jgi:hypothetical protein
MLSKSAATNRPNNAYPTFLQSELFVPLVEIVKPANPDSTPRKSTVSTTYLFARLRHIIETVLHAERSHKEAQNPEPYNMASAAENPSHSTNVLSRVVRKSVVSNVIKRDKNHPPKSMANPKASKAESTYIPILQLLSIVLGFGSYVSDNRMRTCLLVGFIAVASLALFLCFRVALSSTDFSHLISSTVNFTLPYIR